MNREFVRSGSKSSPMPQESPLRWSLGPLKPPSKNWRYVLSNFIGRWALSPSLTLILIVGLVVPWMSWGCSDDGVAPCQGAECDGNGPDPVVRCTVKSDCPVGLECIDESCVRSVECRTNQDCPGEGLCLRNACFDPVDASQGNRDLGGPTTDMGSDMERFDADNDLGQCQGCFDSREGEASSCLVGTSNSACGNGGQECQQCHSGQECIEGNCTLIPLCTPQNCGGCCLGDQCIEASEARTSADSCGSDGLQCEFCDGFSSCVDGMCVPPCTSSTCPGCCEDDVCYIGSTFSSTTCGRQGGECYECSNRSTCSDGRCVFQECAMSCQGCCIAGECSPGNADDACGLDGAGCRTCSEFQSCTEGECRVVSNTSWDIYLLSATVPRMRQDGSAWDPYGGLPDPGLRMTFREGDAQSPVLLETDVLPSVNTLNPQWGGFETGQLLFENVPVDTALKPLYLDIYDDDVNTRETIQSCVTILLEEEIGGDPIWLSCTDLSTDDPLGDSVFVWLRLQAR